VALVPIALKGATAVGRVRPTTALVMLPEVRPADPIFGNA